MSDSEFVLYLLGLLVVVAPAVLVAGLGLTSLLDRHLSEEATDTWIRATVAVALLAALGVLGLMLATDNRHVVIDLGNWVEIEHHGAGAAGDHAHYHFDVKFVYDRLSVP